ncbi:hypothetical protein [Aneurinibacillus terranovensis]|uniref:hypothetical protein n=1 Tax=Aneurinibacillus terranovensis TaxID=278991 RepID=UPI0004811C50
MDEKAYRNLTFLKKTGAAHFPDVYELMNIHSYSWIVITGKSDYFHKRAAQYATTVLEQVSYNKSIKRNSS